MRGPPFGTADTMTQHSELTEELESKAVALFRRSWRRARQECAMRFKLVYEVQGTQHVVRLERVIEQEMIGKG